MDKRIKIGSKICLKKNFWRTLRKHDIDKDSHMATMPATVESINYNNLLARFLGKERTFIYLKQDVKLYKKTEHPNYFASEELKALFVKDEMITYHKTFKAIDIYNIIVKISKN